MREALAFKRERLRAKLSSFLFSPVMESKPPQ
jgi:hypothetical protein